MSKSWYYQIMGETIGPLTSEELRGMADRREIVRETSIRKGTNGDWEPAWCVKGLYDDNPSDPDGTHLRANKISAEDLDRIAVEAVSGVNIVPGKSGNMRPKDKLNVCPDCKRMVSKLAMTCVHCGRPLKSSPANSPSPRVEKRGIAEHAGIQGPHIVAIVCAVVLAIGCCLPWILLGALL